MTEPTALPPPPPPPPPPAGPLPPPTRPAARSDAADALRTGGRALVLLVGAVATVLAIGGSAVGMGAGLGHEEVTESLSFPAGIRRVSVDVDAGSIEVRGAERDTVVGERRLSIGVRRPTVREEIVGDTLHLGAGCGHIVVVWCGAAYVLEVPRGVAVVADSSAGSVSVEGVDGDVEARSSAGRVTAADVGGALTLESSAGRVEGTRLRSPRVSADSTAGRVALSFVRPPTAVTATSTAGSVRVELPRDDTVYRVETHASAGEVVVGVTNSPTSDRVVVADSSAGRVEVVHPDG